MSIYRPRDVNNELNVQGEVFALVDVQLVDGEVHDDLLVTDSLDTRSTELDVEVDVAAAGASGTTVLGKRTHDVVFMMLRSSKHGGLQPSRRQERIDLLNRNAADLVDERTGVGHRREVDGDGEVVIVEVGQGEENVVARIGQEAKIMEQVVVQSLLADVLVGINVDEVSLCRGNQLMKRKVLRDADFGNQK